MLNAVKHLGSAGERGHCHQKPGKWIILWGMINMIHLIHLIHFPTIEARFRDPQQTT
jgi:hypothetical protein